MPARIDFSSVIVRGVGLNFQNDAKTVRINVTGSMTQEIRKKMNWQKGEVPDGAGEDFRTVEDAATEIKLDGVLNASELTIEPNAKELQSKGVKFDIREVRDFKLVNVADGEGATKPELRFQIITNSPGVLGKLEKFLDACGQAKATFKVSYHKQQTFSDVQADEEIQRELAEQMPV